LNLGTRFLLRGVVCHVPKFSFLNVNHFSKRNPNFIKEFIHLNLKWFYFIFIFYLNEFNERLTAIDYLREHAIKKDILDIKIMNRPVTWDNQREDNAYGCRLKPSREIHSPPLPSPSRMDRLITATSNLNVNYKRKGEDEESLALRWGMRWLYELLCLPPSPWL
jgi:hypothetical protein